MRFLIVLDIVADYGRVKSMRGHIQWVKDVAAALGDVLHQAAYARGYRGTSRLWKNALRDIETEVSHDIFGSVELEEGFEVALGDWAFNVWELLYAEVQGLSLAVGLG